MLLIVTHSALTLSAEKHLPTNVPLSQLKQQLYRITGTPPERQALELRDRTTGAVLCGAMDDELSLDDYGVQELMRLHVVDTDPLSQARAAELEDVSRVEKYVMSDEQYNARRDTFRKFKAAHREMFDRPVAGAAPQDASAQVPPVAPAAPPAGIHVGDRCKVVPEGADASVERRGVVRFVGTVRGRTGYWVGVELDEPMGTMDGTVAGARIFECGPGHGLLVEPGCVTCGDFPELSDWATELRPTA